MERKSEKLIKKLAFEFSNPAKNEEDVTINFQDFAKNQKIEKTIYLYILFLLISKGKQYFEFHSIAKQTYNLEELALKGWTEFSSKKYFKVFGDSCEKIYIKKKKEAEIQVSGKYIQELCQESNTLITKILYYLIQKAGKKGITYNELSKELNKLKLKSNSKTSLQTANSCKKGLEKAGLIQSFDSENRHERILVESSKYLKYNALTNDKISKFEDKSSFKPKHFDPDSFNKLQQEVMGLTMKETILEYLRSDIAQKNNGLTINDLAYMFNSSKYKKKIIKLIEEMRISEKGIKCTIEDSGKNKSNRYYFDNADSKIMIASNSKISKLLNIFNPTNQDTQQEIKIKSILSKQLILDLEGFKSILDHANSLGYFDEGEIISKSKDGYPEKMLVNEVFNDLSKLVLVKNEGRITIEKINRYIYIINKVNKNKVVSFLDLWNYIMNDLESGTYIKMDRKTLKRIILNLVEWKFIKIKKFELTLNIEENPKQSCKIIAFSNDISEDDPRIFNDPAITNPTFRRGFEISETVKAKLQHQESKVSNLPIEADDLNKTKCSKKEASAQRIVEICQRIYESTINSCIIKLRSEVFYKAIRNEMINLQERQQKEKKIEDDLKFACKMEDSFSFLKNVEFDHEFKPDIIKSENNDRKSFAEREYYEFESILSMLQNQTRVFNDEMISEKIKKLFKTLNFSSTFSLIHLFRLFRKLPNVKEIVQKLVLFGDISIENDFSSLSGFDHFEAHDIAFQEITKAENLSHLGRKNKVGTRIEDLEERFRYNFKVKRIHESLL